MHPLMWQHEFKCTVVKVISKWPPLQFPSMPWTENCYNTCITVHSEANFTLPLTKISTFVHDWNVHLCTGTNQMPLEEKSYGQTRQRISYLTTITRGIFGGVKVRLSDLRTLTAVFLDYLKTPTSLQTIIYGLYLKDGSVPANQPI